MTTLGNLDSNEIGRYDETTPIGSGGTPTFSQYMNAALISVSAAFTKYVRNKTIFRRTTTATIASNASYQVVAMAVSVTGSAFTHSSGVFTCTVAGNWRMKFTISFGANTTGIRGVRLAGSGVLGARQRAESVASNSLDHTMEIEWITTLAVNDTISTQVIQNSGVALTAVGDITFERIL
jgi:hypothetical protein